MQETPAIALHRKLKGKIRVHASKEVKTPEDLSLLYTPGVAEACRLVVEDPSQVWELTGIGNTVAVISDGTAVLGLGNIGPSAGLPVMEGKALLFQQFAGIHAVPLVLGTTDPEKIVEICAALAPSFGGINLEDISAPRCFEVETRLQERLNIPVFHDDQHGTAVVVLAGIINALKILNKSPLNTRIVLNGAGAAGNAIAIALLEYGFSNLIICDKAGILNAEDPLISPHHLQLALKTNPENFKGQLKEALFRADIFIGVSGPGVLTLEMIQSMGDNPVIFALANPTPEILPEQAMMTKAKILAFGRSDVRNQINNVLAFPGLFRGALDVRASRISERMMSAASLALASLVTGEELEENIVIPRAFNPRVAYSVALASAKAAQEQGLAGLFFEDSQLKALIQRNIGISQV